MIKHKKYKHYERILGLNKHQILEILGNEFNHLPHNIWTYEIAKNWLGLRIFLVIYFVDNIAVKILIKKKFGIIKLVNNEDSTEL